MAALLPAPSPHDPAASSPVTSIDIDSLVASVSGTVIRPDDEAYDEARHIHNTLIDRKPSLIVRAADAADVARAVTFAADHGLELAVRAGGHSIHSATRRRPRRRPVGDEGPPHRPRAAPRLGPARPDRRRVHGRGRGPRARDAVRRHRQRGTRRPDARRRDRLARPQARPHDRQPRLGRARHRRRPDRHRERAAQPGPLLGGPRRRRQLRRRDPVRVPPPPGRDRPGRRAVPARDPRGPRGPRARPARTRPRS